MERPLSIVWFERCYLGSLVVLLVQKALSWNAMIAASNAKLEDNPAAAQFGPSFVSGILVGTIVLMIVISLLLWYFTAKKASVVTKWIITVLFALNVLSVVMGAVRGTMEAGSIGAVLGIVALVLNGIAVWQLFKPDARAWFGEIKA